MDSPCELAWDEYAMWFSANAKSGSNVRRKKGRRYATVYCVHDAGYYMFFVRNAKGKLMLLRGAQTSGVDEELEHYDSMLKRYAETAQQLLFTSGLV